jgi:hypothetical protein
MHVLPYIHPANNNISNNAAIIGVVRKNSDLGKFGALPKFGP